MTARQRLREARAWLAGGFLLDPTHVSLGLLCLVIAYSLVQGAYQADPLPPFLMYGWAGGLTLAGLGKVIGPYLYGNPEREAFARALILAASILAGTCWTTIAIGAFFLGPGATMAVLQGFALAIGALGRAYVLGRNAKTVDRHTPDGGGPS
jgi:hypothetical protein